MLCSTWIPLRRVELRGCEPGAGLVTSALTCRQCSLAMSRQSSAARCGRYAGEISHKMRALLLRVLNRQSIQDLADGILKAHWAEVARVARGFSRLREQTECGHVPVICKGAIWLLTPVALQCGVDTCSHAAGRCSPCQCRGQLRKWPFAQADSIWLFQCLLVNGTRERAGIGSGG